MDPRHREVVSAANDRSSRPIRVIALVHPCPVDFPAEMTLLSLEQWTTFMALRWFFGTPDAADEIDLRLQRGLEWEAEDDLGSHYVGGDFGGGGGNGPHWVKTTWFAPALNAKATRLSFRFQSPLGGRTLETEVDLQRSGSEQTPPDGV